MENNSEFSSSTEEEIVEKAEWLLNKIKESIAIVGDKRRKNQKRASIIKMALLVLSGSATILLGLNLSGQELIFKSIAFVFSVFVTSLTALEPFFNYRALWVEQEQAKAKLHRLEDRLVFYLTGKNNNNISLEAIASINEDYQNIWEELSNAWIKERRLGSKKINQAIDTNKLND